MKSNPMVEALKTEVKNNSVFRDVCHMFSLRQRTRNRLTVTRLKQAMESEGFNHTRKQYEEVLRFMGKLGLGQLDFSKRGKVKALNDIKIKLQSIGQVALSQASSFENKPEPTRYETLPVMPQSQRKTTQTAPKKDEEPYPVFLTMILDGKLINIPGPKDVTPDNIGEFIVEFKKLANKKKDVEI